MLSFYEHIPRSFHRATYGRKRIPCKGGTHYSEAAENDAIGQQDAACAGCVSSEQVMDAYAESFRLKMQDSLQDMIFNAGIGIALFSMGAGFSTIYVKYYRNVQPIL